ncbi:MAG: hypothetical protein ABIP94_13170, partial [Planctomycetota bacterium]
MRTHCFSVSVLFLVNTLCAPIAAQHIWKVNCLGGPGVDFTDLPPAVAAAAPGDEIWVYANYGTICPVSSYYTATLITKPLRIVGFDPSGSPSPSAPSWARFHGVFVIHGIAAGQQVLLSNIDLGQGGFGTQGGVVAVDCAGDILLEDVAYSGIGIPGTYVRFERCANVVLRGCTMVLGGYPMQFIDSTALLTTTTVYHPTAAFIINMPYEQTSEAVLVSNSTVTLIGSILRGGNRYDTSGMGFPQQNWIARPAAVIESGTLRIGPASRLYGGLNGQPYPLDREYAYRHAPPGTGTVERDPRSVLSFWSMFGAQPIPVDIPATYHAWVVAAQDFQVTVSGPNNGFGLLAIGDWQPIALPTSLCPLAITPASLTLLDIAPLSATNGAFEWT